MKVPSIRICKKCSHVRFRPWFFNKMQEWEDMDYDYISFRPSLLICARKDLCAECSERLISDFDRANEYVAERRCEKKLTDKELEDAWKDCHGWGY